MSESKKPSNFSGHALDVSFHEDWNRASSLSQFAHAGFLRAKRAFLFQELLLSRFPVRRALKAQ